MARFKTPKEVSCRWISTAKTAICETVGCDGRMWNRTTKCLRLKKEKMFYSIMVLCQTYISYPHPISWGYQHLIFSGFVHMEK